MKTCKPLAGSVLAVAILASVQTILAGNVSMTADDGFGNSSFNSAGSWDSAAAPTAGNDYFNATKLLRTPADASSHTFAGDSLTITGAGLATAVNNEALMWKGSGTGSIITVNNLIINGGQLRHGQGSADSFTLAGNLTVGANGANFASQGGMFVNSVIAGSSTIRILDSGNTEVGRFTSLGNSANTFTGNIELAGSAADRCRLTLADNANLNYVIGANGVNNSISGTGTLTLDGIFNIDLTGADNTVGDSWTLVDSTALSVTYGGTFGVNGFADEGSGLWDTTANGVSYSFDTGSGILSVAAVPEPSTLAVCGLSAFGLLLAARRKK